MKTILIPTDFSATVFAQVENILGSLNDERITLYFFHSFSLPESEQDLLGFNGKPHLTVLNEAFRKNCCRLKEKYSGVLATVGFRHLYGNSRSVMMHFLEHNEISQLFIPEGLVLKTVNPRSTDLIKLLLTTGVPVLEPAKEHFRLRFESRGAIAERSLEPMAS